MLHKGGSMSVHILIRTYADEETCLLINLVRYIRLINIARDYYLHVACMYVTIQSRVRADKVLLAVDVIWSITTFYLDHTHT